VEWNTTTKQPIVLDRYTASVPKQGVVGTDESQNCPDNILPNSISGEQTSNSSIIRFARKLDTGDAICDHVITPGQTIVSFAYAKTGSTTPNTLAFHSSHAGTAPLDWFPSTSTTGSTPSSTSTSSNPKPNKTSLEGNAVIAIVVGVIAATIGIANLVVARVLTQKKSLQVEEKRGLLAN